MENNSDNSEIEFSIDDKYSINGSKVGVFKEEIKSNFNKSTSGIWTSKIVDKNNDNEEEDEISDINMTSDHESDIEEYDMISNINQEINKTYNNNNNYSSDEEKEYDDRFITRKKYYSDELKYCCRNLYEKEDDLVFNMNEGFTQMVDKNIIKFYDDPFYVKNEMIEVLMIAEKPSLARVISEILGTKRLRRYHYDPMTIYTFEGLFKGKKAFFTVSSIRGHIYQDAFEEDCQDENIDVNDLYNEKIVKILKRNNDNDNEHQQLKNLNIPKFLRNIAKEKDILCLWLDCDPEGENICYEVIHNVYPYMNKRKYQQIYRAKFNSLTKKDIKESFNNLRDYPNKNLSMSVDARAIIDFKVGVCFTRLFSTQILRFIKKYNKEGFVKKVMSYGPCQTPTLWFCVQRLKERKKYIPKSYYQIYVEIEDENDKDKDNNNKKYKLYMNKKFENKRELLKRLDKIKFNFFVDLKKITYKKKKQPPPAGLKTLTMLKMASLQLGLSPYDASRDAQLLYMNGLISYPRTKSTKYSENYDFESSLKMFRNNIHFSEKLNDLLENFNKSNIDFSRGEEKGGHEPIVPTLSVTEDTIKNFLNWDLYKSICLYYFASLSPPLEYENKDYEFTIDKYKLKLSSSKIIKEGFLKFLPLKNKTFDKKFPSFEENNHYKIVNIDYEKHHYLQLNYLTEAELIDEMEKKSIGTDGSTPSHIRNLTKRGYAKINENRRIIPTKLGVALIDSLSEIVPEIVKPENRAKIEDFVKEIETGEKSFKEAIDAALEFYKEKLKYCSIKIDKVK